MIEEMFNKLRLISKAFNSSSNVDEFAVKLDLASTDINLTMQEAERLYEKNCKDIIERMKEFWCIDGRFRFSKAFEDVPLLCEGCSTMKHYALPCFLCRDSSDEMYGAKLVLAASDMNGNPVIERASLTFIDELAKYGINAYHEAVMTMMQAVTFRIERRRNGI